MIRFAKDVLKRTPVYSPLRQLYHLYQLKLISAWIRGIFRFGFGCRCTIGFTPDQIEDYSQMTRIMLLNRYSLRVPPDSAPRIGIYWAYGAENKEPNTDWQLTINEQCRDISKSYVETLHREVFGYGLSVDPLTFHGSAFVKADENALHDGHIEELPTPVAAPGMVYQRLIANEMADGTRQDIRIPVVANTIPFVFLVYRRLGETIGGRVMGKTRLCKASDVLSDVEVGRVLRLCKAIGLDFGEVDALRDRNDGRLYVVDVNRAVGVSVMPREMTTEADYWKQLTALANLFDDTYVIPILDRQRQ